MLCQRPSGSIGDPPRSLQVPPGPSRPSSSLGGPSYTFHTVALSAPSAALQLPLRPSEGEKKPKKKKKNKTKKKKEKKEKKKQKKNRKNKKKKQRRL